MVSLAVKLTELRTQCDRKNSWKRRLKNCVLSETIVVLKPKNASKYCKKSRKM